MKKILKLIPIILLSIVMVISSCKKEIDGCTDSSAMNYSSDATSNASFTHVGFAQGIP